MTNHSNIVSLVWNIADILRGSWKQYEYQDVILPMVLLKRLDIILAPTKQKVLETYNEHENEKDTVLDPILTSITGVGFYNKSRYDFHKLLEEPSQVGPNFRTYLNGFSENIRDIFEKFDFDKHLQRLQGGNLLYYIIKELNKVDLHPDNIDNHEMGQIFEELLRKFAEQSNETAGEHYTPRDVIKVMVEILFEPDKEELKKPHIARRIYDCACGTGGMLTVSKDFIKHEINPNIDLYLYGQELNPQTYALCKADMLIKGDNPDFIKGGDKDHSQASTLSNDQFYGEQFDYLLTNPPYGVDWKKDKEAVKKEATRGFGGRFGAGTPRISDGQLLFLQHLVSKMKPIHDGGSRMAIILNGSPLFTGSAGSGESEIRRWLLEKDLVEAIIAMPDQLFYNTGISTYIWILSNRKAAERKGKVQLIDARGLFSKMRKSLGQKRKEISDEARAKIVELYKEFKESKKVKIFDTTEFGYRQITIERPLKLNWSVTPERIERLKAQKDFAQDLPNKGAGEKAAKENLEWQEFKNKVFAALEAMPKKTYEKLENFRADFKQAADKQGLVVSPKYLKIIEQELSERDEDAPVIIDSHGNPQPDPELRDTENVPLGTDVEEYFQKEVLPYVPGAWINTSKRDHKDNEVGIIGYEIPFTRYFYEYKPPRDLEEIEKDIKETEKELVGLLKEVL